jgi:hypothetical protein
LWPKIFQIELIPIEDSWDSNNGYQAD